MACQVQDPGRRSQPVGLRDQASRARLGPRPGGEGPRGHVDRSGSRRDHGQRMDRPLEGHAGCRPQHHGEPRVPDPPVHPAVLGQADAELAHRRGNHRLGAETARHRGGVPQHGERCAQPAAHHPRRRGSGKTPADPLQPRRPPAQPRAQDRPQARPQPAARVGDAAGGAARGRASRAAGRPGRRVHHAGHDRLHRHALGRDDRPGARPAAPGADQRRVAAQGGQRPLPPAPAEGRLLPQHAIRAARAGRPSRIPRRTPGRPGRKRARQRCACAAGHDGSGRYVFLGPDGGHHRNSNYGRRVFRPACDGRHPPANQQARQAGRRGRHGMAGHPGRVVAASRAREALHSPVRPGHPPPDRHGEHRGAARPAGTRSGCASTGGSSPTRPRSATARAAGSRPPTAHRWRAGCRSRTG